MSNNKAVKNDPSKSAVAAQNVARKKLQKEAAAAADAACGSSPAGDAQRYADAWNATRNAFILEARKTDSLADGL